MRKQQSFEKLDARVLLAGDLIHDAAADAQIDVAPQFVVNHPPRLQPGNMPLVGTPAFDGRDRVDVIWQTVPAGDGLMDSFTAEYRRVGESNWRSASQFNEPILTDQHRVMHSVTLLGLGWATDYEYRIQHLRAGTVVGTWSDSFQTRLPTGDSRRFSFAAYGDSANRGRIEPFNAVQAEIDRRDLDFSLLLGDNFYTFGTHTDADGRFDPHYSPEAVRWTARKIDYFAIGNHDLFVNNGQASRDLYSVPVPEIGVTSPVSLPAGEFAEHSYSFDYGDVHFVTIDTNPVDFAEPEERTARLDALIDYAVADLNASDARWKIVFGHHPFIGTEKRMMPEDFYFQKIVSSLQNADVDLVLLGHSHSYSWTYPLTGWNDVNDDGHIAIEEVEFDNDPDQNYEKGAGLIQVVSGVGGNSLRHTGYPEDYFAQGYSLHETTPAAEYGFAQIDVTPHSLKVSYISAETGQIVGDTNENGIHDPDELHFGQFSIVDSSVPSGDFNGDSTLDQVDIDLLTAAIRLGTVDPEFDLNLDQRVDLEDHSHLLEAYMRVAPGDSNLDGRFDSRDLVIVFTEDEYEDDQEDNTGWFSGDWNGDGDFTAADLVFAFQKGDYLFDVAHAALPAAASFDSPPRQEGSDRYESIQSKKIESDTTEVDATYGEIADVAAAQATDSPLPTGCEICGTGCFMKCLACSKPLRSSEYRPNVDGDPDLGQQDRTDGETHRVI